MINDIIELQSPQGGQSRIYFQSAEEALQHLLPHRRVVVVTDANVHRHHKQLIESFEHIIIGQGENNKTLQTVQDIFHQLLEMEADRDTFLLGIGGGIVTDITGFVASTYMRGIDFGFVPTTLLAQVDASVGGKNGVNFEGYKNIMGCFVQPEFVVCDTALLATLPEREFRTGMAEVIKMGIIGQPALVELLEGCSMEQMRNDRALLEQTISQAVRGKVDIVQHDEHESGERRKLNFGHTLAHAIEKCSRDYTHGEAVAIGMVQIAAIGVRLGITPESDARRIRSLVERYGLPVDMPVEPRRIAKATLLDKKRTGENIKIVLPESAGSCRVYDMPVERFEGLISSEATAD